MLVSFAAISDGQVSNSTDLKRYHSNEEAKLAQERCSSRKSDRPRRWGIRRTSDDKHVPCMLPVFEKSNGDGVEENALPSISPRPEMLTQTFLEHELQQQASDLIKNALARAKHGGKEKEHKSSRGALAALGLRAAGIGAPQQAHVAASEPSTANPSPVSSRPQSILQPARPISTPDSGPSPVPTPPPAVRASTAQPPAQAPRVQTAPVPAQAPPRPQANVQPPDFQTPSTQPPHIQAAPLQPPHLQPAPLQPPHIQPPAPAPVPAPTQAPVQRAPAQIPVQAAPAQTPVVQPPAAQAVAAPVDGSMSKPIKSQPIRGGVPVGGDPAQSARSPSPFFRARKSREDQRARDRDPSPEVGALRKDSLAAESDAESTADERGRRLGSIKSKFRPQASAYESPDESGNEADFTDDGPSDMDDDTDFDGDAEDGAYDDPNADFFDEETERNTEANAIYDVPGLQSEDRDPEAALDPNANFDVYGEEIEQDVLGEGPNVIIPEEPLFPNPKEYKVVKSLRSGLDVVTSRPTFARDRCTITITQGDPDGALERLNKGMRRYVVLSDLSDESRYAVEWAIGTVARDGDEVFLISVMEDEHKVDPKKWGNRDQAQKMKLQKEVSKLVSVLANGQRQTQCLLLVRQVTGLLQRTRLNITVTCQALHAKNARYMLLDLIDFLEPTLVIVGSRGLGQLKGILLGSTSHYLVQKSSVPVMVARRRMYRPPRRTNPEKLRHSPRVSLASANIEKTASTKQEDDIADAADDIESEGPAPK